MARLNKTQICAIRWLGSQGMTNDKIAIELDLNIEQVQKTLEKYTKSSSQSEISTAKSPVNSSMITKTSGKGLNNVAIMTKEASEQHDAARGKLAKQSDKGIFRPKKNG